jgi:DNA-binding IclR family transcriptional regulator
MKDLWLVYAVDRSVRTVVRSLIRSPETSMATGTHKADGAGQTVRAVDRALQIMSLFDEGRDTITLKDVLAKTKLAKTTAIRLIQTLEHNGLLQSNGNGELIGGLALMRWANLAARTWMLPVEAQTILESLASTCRETVNLYVRRDIYRVCLAQQEGPQTLRQVVRVGDHLPLWAGGAAKILLLEASPELLLAVARDSPYGASHVKTLEQWVAQARELGYATSAGERELGLASIAVPLRNRSGSLLAALSLGGPSERFGSDRISEFVHELTTTADVLRADGLVEHLPTQTT